MASIDQLSKSCCGLPQSKTNFIAHQVGAYLRNIIHTVMPQEVICCEQAIKKISSQYTSLAISVAQSKSAFKRSPLYPKDASPDPFYDFALQIVLYAILLATASEDASCLHLLQSSCWCPSVQYCFETRGNDTKRGTLQFNII